MNHINRSIDAHGKFDLRSNFQATVYLLEKLDILLSKASEEEIKSDVLPMIFSTLESNSIQGQVRMVSASAGKIVARHTFSILKTNTTHGQVRRYIRLQYTGIQLCIRWGEVVTTGKPSVHWNLTPYKIRWDSIWAFDSMRPRFI